jgi:non-ribosomal peptide synthetase component F
MSRLAVLAALIAAESGQRDVVLGTYADNRTRLATLAMLGPFANPVTLKLQFDPEVTFRNWLITVRDVVAETAAHWELPHDELVKHLAQDRIRVPDLSIFFSTTQSSDPQRFANLRLEPLPTPVKLASSVVTIHCAKRAETYDWSVMFDPKFYDPAGARKFTNRFSRLLAGVCQQPDLRLGEVLAFS